MNWHPMIFTAQSVRAILNGQKTQTRRILKSQPEETSVRWNGNGYEIFMGYPHGHDVPICPYGKVGDGIWVRETLQRGVQKMMGTLEGHTIQYAADCTPVPYSPGAEIGWNEHAMWQWPGRNKRPSIFMPRWASRILLEIVEIRVERVQDISEQDAVAEGISEKMAEEYWYDGPQYVGAVSVLWDEINAARGYSWESNPWVFAISFKVV